MPTLNNTTHDDYHQYPNTTKYPSATMPTPQAPLPPPPTLQQMRDRYSQNLLRMFPLPFFEAILTENAQEKEEKKKEKQEGEDNTVNDDDATVVNDAEPGELHIVRSSACTEKGKAKECASGDPREKKRNSMVEGGEEGNAGNEQPSPPKLFIKLRGLR
jgi:hypothetical protein